MTPLEVVTALVGGMDATDRAKVAKMLGVTANPATQPDPPCRRLGHAFKVTSPGGWFSGPVLTCTRCGRERQSK